MTLPLPIAIALEEAMTAPADVDLSEALTAFDQMLQVLPPAQQLVVAAEALAELAIAQEKRSEAVLDEWDNRHNPRDPVIDWSSYGKTRHFDPTQLVQKPPRCRSKPKQSKPQPTDTIVSEVDKAKVLDLLDAVEAKAEALAIAHDENVEDWTAEIAQFFAENPQPVDLLELRDRLDWPLVKLWLALLLGGFSLCGPEDPDQFYTGRVVVQFDRHNGQI